MRASHLRYLFALIVAAGAIAACGDDSNGVASGDGSGDVDLPADVSDDGDADGEEWPPTDLRGSGAAGTVTVDGVEYGIDVVLECDLASLREWYATHDSRSEPQLRVEGVGLADPDDPEFSELVEITLTRHDYRSGDAAPVRDLHEVRWRGPEGLLDNSALGGDTWMSGSHQIDGPPFDFDGDRITGMLNSQGDGGGTDIEVDLAQPTDGPVDCE